MSPSILGVIGRGSDAMDGDNARAGAVGAAASPSVLADLHAAWVRQLRNGALAAAAVTALAAVVAVVVALGGKPFAQLWLLVGIMAAQTVWSTFEWWSARRVDPRVAAVHEPVEAEVERERIHAHRARLAERGAPVTMALAILMIIVTVVEWFTAGSVGRTVARAGLVKLLVADGEWWRLGTSTFVHAGAFHLGANVAGILLFGRIVEAYVPRAWLITVYAVSGLVGGFASWWWSPAANSLGASGAVMGVVAFTAVLSWRRRAAVPAGVRRSTLMTLTASGFVGALSFGLIDNGAHAGGALAGALLALVAVSTQASRDGAGSRGLAVIGAVCGAAVVLSAVHAIIALASRPAGLAGPVPVRQNATRVSSVSVAPERDGSTWALRVTNHSSQLLEAYMVTMPLHGMLWRDDCCIASDGARPVRPGDSIQLPLDGIRPIGRAGVPANLSVAVFADGSYEGDATAYGRIITRRRQTAEETAFWLQKMDVAMKLPPNRAGARLAAYSDIRLMATGGWNTPIVALGIPPLIRVADQQPARFAAEAAATRSRILEAQSALTARLSGGR